MDDIDAGPRSSVRRLAAQLAVLVVVTFLGGVLTFFAQGLLPEGLASFANSASGWTLVTALAVWALRAAPVPAAVFGAVGFVLLVVGYAVAAGWQGLYYDPRFFGAIGLLVGPFVGLAASWLDARGWRAALGAGFLAGIGIGESAYGLVQVAATTSPVYWVLIGVVGVALLVRTAVRRASVGIAATGVAAAVAVMFFVVYSAL